MTSNPVSTATATGPEVPTVAEGAADLASAVEELAAVERAMCRAVMALSRTIGTGVCETVEGLPTDLLLANLCRLIQADRSTIMTAADVLRTMPVTAGLWADGQLSWGQVRNIALKASRLPAVQRGSLDRRIDQTARDHDGVTDYGPDGLLDAVDRAVDELRDLADILKQEEAQERAEFVALQGTLDGGMKIYGELGPVRGAKISKAMHDAAPPIQTGLRRGQRLAAGLETMAERSLGGAKGAAKPSMDVIVDLTQVTVTAAGTVDLNVTGPLPRLSARIVETLNRDADLRVTLFDGKRPLASSRRRKAEAIPASVRRAVALRDRGDRMPGSMSPLAHTDVHHIHRRGNGGDHHPDRLAALKSGHHQLIHRRRWHDRLDPTTGRFTITRDGRTYASLPRGTPLSPDPNPPPASGDPPSASGDPPVPSGDPPRGSPDPPEPPTSSAGSVDHDGDPLPF